MGNWKIVSHDNAPVMNAGVKNIQHKQVFPLAKALLSSQSQLCQQF